MIVAQRLVRRICVDCKQVYQPSAELLAGIELEPGPGQLLYQGTGCGSCNGTGYRGRLALYEVMLMSETLRDAVIGGTPSNQLKRMAIAEGMETLRKAARTKSSRGGRRSARCCRRPFRTAVKNM